MSTYPISCVNPQRQRFEPAAAVPPPPPPITLRCSCSYCPPSCSRRIRPRPWTPPRWSPRWCKSASSVTCPASIRFCRAALLQAPPATSAKPRALQQITQPALRPLARAAPLPPAPASLHKMPWEAANAEFLHTTLRTDRRRHRPGHHLQQPGQPQHHWLQRHHRQLPGYVL